MRLGSILGYNLASLSINGCETSIGLQKPTSFTGYKSIPFFVCMPGMSLVANTFQPPYRIVAKTTSTV